MKELEMVDLNKRITDRASMAAGLDSYSWVKGILDACNMMNDRFEKECTALYLPGDLILFKLNLITKKQLRKNEQRIVALDDYKISITKEGWLRIKRAPRPKGEHDLRKFIRTGAI